MWGPLLAALSRLFATRIGQWIAAAMAWLGLTWATQSAVVQPLIDEIKATAQGVSGPALEWLGYLQFDVALSMVFSALAAKYAIQAGRAFLMRRT